MKGKKRRKQASIATYVITAILTSTVIFNKLNMYSGETNFPDKKYHLKITFKWLLNVLLIESLSLYYKIIFLFVSCNLILSVMFLVAIIIIMKNKGWKTPQCE